MSDYVHYTAQGQPPQVKTYRAALYLRLSKADGDDLVSDSITNQKKLVTDFVDHQPDIEWIDCYVDDGYTGTNFNRPGFIRMMEDIDKKRVNCVIVKDGSRFGRILSDTDNYLRRLFPLMGVRFISVTDGIDLGKKAHSSSGDFVNITVRGMMNEYFVADTSDKIRSTLNIEREQGDFIGAFAKYGYRKNPLDRHKLLIDEEAAQVVRLIYRLYLGGTGIRGIVRYLNDRGVPNPSAYKQQKGFRFKARTVGGSPLWGDKTVRRILRDEMYIGTMVQGKNRKVTYLDKAIRACSPSEWIRVEGTHEAIIRPEDYAQAQRMLDRSVKAANPAGEINLFAGLLYCADCGHALIKKTNRNPDKTYVYYRCASHCKCRTACTAHTIRWDRLYAAVLTTIQKMIDVAVDADAVIREMKSRKSADAADALRTQLEHHERELREVKHLLADLYPDYKKGILSEEMYRMNREKYERMKDKLAQKIEMLKASLSESASPAQPNAFIEHFMRYGSIDRLTRPLLTELIDRITVSEDGSLDIAFNFADAFADAMLLTENQRSA